MSGRVLVLVIVGGLAAGWAGVATSSEIPDAEDQCVTGLAQTTPSLRFTLRESGAVVYDMQTDLEWQRCAIGMNWEDGECTGTASAFNWQGALTAGGGAGDNWRLPNVRELGTIVERCRHNPTTNIQVFPNAPVAFFWSSSPHAEHPLSAWGLNFFYGNKALNDKQVSARVRLVRDAP